MRSRRGRELAPTQILQANSAGKDRIERYYKNTALLDLGELIASWTHDRAPQALVEAHEALVMARTPEEASPYLRSSYKIIRDAANDQIRLMNGETPNSYTGSYTFRWGQATVIRIASQQMGPEGTFDSRTERFNVEDHKLARNPGNLAGSVHDDYTGYRHHLQSGSRWDTTVNQVSIEKAYRPEQLPIDVPPKDT